MYGHGACSTVMDKSGRGIFESRHNSSRSMNRSATLIPFLLMVFAGCLQSEESSPATVDEPESLYFESVGIGQAGSLSDTTEVLIRSEEDWQVLRDSLRVVEPFREVDFSQTMLLLVALPQSSGGYRIQMESVDKSDEEILASYAVYAPGPDCLTIMAETLPYQVVAVRRAEGTVRFNRRVIRETCKVE